MGKYLLLAAVLIAALAWWSRASRAHTPMPWDASHLAALTADLSDAAGNQAPPRALSGARRMLIFFSASWCPPCRVFTPRLVEWYQAHGSAATLPLLFVSADRSAAEMKQHMIDDHMPWWGVAFGSDSARALAQAYGSSLYPDLVLIDDHGQVLADSYTTGPYHDLEHVLTAAAAAAGP